MRNERVLKLVVLGLIVVGVLLISGVLLVPSGAVTRSIRPLSPGPDLVVESIAVAPLVPDVGQPYTITVVIRNQGSQSTGSFLTTLYVDPADRPPNVGTMPSNQLGYFGLGPGASFTLKYSDQFAMMGCDHVVYAWVDRDDQVTEDDENNNLSSKQICVGATPTHTPTPTATPTATPTPCVPDEHEPDDTCGSAGEIDTVGTHQMHNLCPVGDEDWVAFSARAGITYTIETSAVEEDGDTVLDLYDTCGAPPIASDDPISATVARIVWHCTTSGTYYAKVSHHDGDYGPATDYELSITASTHCPGDLYEKDDSCAAAREIPADGSSQTRLFCAAGDHDWVTFKATSGATVLIETDNYGPDAQPVLSIFDACNAPISIGHSQELKWIASTDEVFYVELKNLDSEAYGPDAGYDLSVTTLGCTGDEYEFEGDDDASEARILQPYDPAETHNFCPAGDEDWFKFDASSGKNYVIETFNLGLDSDTYLCLYEPDGATEITCDDDGSGTAAARIIWSCPSDGTYYVQVRHYNENASGPTTVYDLSIATKFQYDSYEPNDSPGSASPISTDGISQTHNFAHTDPESDVDWVKFVADAPGDYAIQTSNLAPGCDTVVELYGPDATTLLASNDDFSFGLGSQVTVTLSEAGTYYARISNYRSARFGTHMQYNTLVVQGTPPPAPTPTPIPTATPPPSPPPSSVKTLIVVNRERMRTLYGAEQANQLMAKLHELASHPRVLGNIIQVENDASASAAYSEWIADPLDTEKANDVASAVRNLILSYLDNNPNVEYLVIVGNDEVIPFRRTLDRTGHSESHYQPFVSHGTTLWAACGDNMSLTDNYYADREPSDYAGQELYIPDFAAGRLIETPEEIMDLIDLFLTGHTTTASSAVVSGYDFIKDVATEMCGILGTDLGGGNVDCELIGEEWNGNQLKTRQLDTVPRFDIQSINGHANLRTEGAPKSPNVRASDIAIDGSSDLSRALIYTLGCHSGFNDTVALDLAQAFSQRGANYIANTGYGWGLGNSIGLSERLMHNFTQELMEGASSIIGKALADAKTRYYSETPDFGDYDEKVVIESTLYGLPMAEIFTGGTLDPEEPFPSVVVTSATSLPLNGYSRTSLDLGLQQSFASLGQTTTDDGTYFDLDGHIHLGAGDPVQPKFYADVSAPDAGRAHGVIFTGGTYTDTPGFDPVIVEAENEYVTPTVELPFDEPGWYPPVPFSLQSSATMLGTETVSTVMGQYRSTDGTERVYDHMSFDVFYSNSYDWWEPIILSVDGALSQDEAKLKVEAVDASDVQEVLVVYTDGDGTQLSQDLTYDEETFKWVGTMPASKETVFFVQVVDGAGNVAVADNKGAWYTLEELETGPSVIYLPVVLKNN
jgi:hypothetical protein